MQRTASAAQRSCTAPQIRRPLINRAARAAIRLYQLTLAPVLGGQCRFEPSCSVYALAAYEKYSFFRATWLVIRRLLKCHPLHPGGSDPA